MKTHCCDTMSQYIDPKCAQHPDPKDCPDALAIYDPRFDSYALLPRFGESWVTVIAFCPWCGDPKRDLHNEYFNRLDALGIDEPFDQELPKEFQTDQWWKDANL